MTVETIYESDRAVYTVEENHGTLILRAEFPENGPRCRGFLPVPKHIREDVREALQ